MLNRPIPRRLKLGILGLSVIVVIGTIPLLLMCPRASNTQSTITIVPGLGVGDCTLGMSKDEVLKKLGKPKRIFYGGERYTLNNLPKHYYMSFDDTSFVIEDDTVKKIIVGSPLFKFTNGLGVSDSEQKIKQAFGDDFQLREGKGVDLLTYEDEGLTFEIHKKDRTVIEINVGKKISRGYSEPIIIVPGVGVGDYTLDMSKDEVLKRLGEPKKIHYGGEDFKLNNLPRRYYMSFDDISFVIEDDTVKMIVVGSPLYKFANGLGVGDSEEKIKQAFGDDFHLKKFGGKVKALIYEKKGLRFEFNEEDRTVNEISVIQPVDKQMENAK